MKQNKIFEWSGRGVGPRRTEDLKKVYSAKRFMENCIFCKIVKGEIPFTKIYEDENFLAFLDIKPLAPGHTQIIPKKHYRWVWDVPNAGEFFEVAKKIALAQKKAFNADIVRSQIYGEEITHAHIWVWPEVAGDGKDLKGNAEKIIQAL